MQRVAFEINQQTNYRRDTSTDRTHLIMCRYSS